MDLQILIGAVAKELCAAGPEIGEPGDELFGRRGGCLFEVNRGHVHSLPHSSSWICLALYVINHNGAVSAQLERLKIHSLNQRLVACSFSSPPRLSDDGCNSLRI